jgi:dihydroorotase
MLGFYHEGKISMERIVEKMCHAPATCFNLRDRGYIDEGMYADLAVIDVNKSIKVQKDNILYKCGWSPFEGHTFRGTVDAVIVSGHLALYNGSFNEEKMGERVKFHRT